MLLLKRHIAFVLLVIVLIDDNKLITINSEGVTINKTVEWDALPTNFLDHEFGNQYVNGIPNWAHIGHVQMIPNHNATRGPQAIKTEFLISDHTACTDISYEATKICLDSQERCKEYPFDLESLKSSPFRPGRRTVIIIHGFSLISRSTNWPRELANLWHKADVNVIRVSWISGSYDVAVTETKYVARQITVLLYYLAELNGVRVDDRDFLNSIYLIGHSLGAHIAGFVGQEFDGQIGRITGLDPAGPRFYDSDPQYRLDRHDALLVDVMHTNLDEKLVDRNSSFSSDVKKIGRYGTTVDSGHIDLYVNDGSHQPHCLLDCIGCSHSAAIDYYISLLTSSLERNRNGRDDFKEVRFMAYRGDNYKDFSTGKSLAYLCPITSTDVRDRTSADLHRCSIPIDYLAPPEDYRRELTEEFNVNLTAKNRFYMLTSPQKPYVNDHYLLLINIPEESSKVPQGKNCSFRAEFLMDGAELSSKFAFVDYKLLPYEDHYKIVVPFVLPIKSEYSARSEPFLKFRIIEYPTAITVSGLTDNKPRKYMREKLKDILFKRKVHEDSCDLVIESVSVRSLRMQPRPTTGYYILSDYEHYPQTIIDEISSSDPSIQINKDDLTSIVHFRLGKLAFRGQKGSEFEIIQEDR